MYECGNVVGADKSCCCCVYSYSLLLDATLATFIYFLTTSYKVIMNLITVTKS